LDSQDPAHAPPTEQIFFKLAVFTEVNQMFKTLVPSGDVILLLKIVNQRLFICLFYLRRIWKFFIVVIKMNLIQSGRILVIILTPLVGFERIILGYHSIAQVIVGALLGIALHFYQTRMPQYMVLWEAILQVFFNFIK
jgi:membrane-associated phospholipid phosphatase